MLTVVHCTSIHAYPNGVFDLIQPQPYIKSSRKEGSQCTRMIYSGNLDIWNPYWGGGGAENEF